MPPHEGGLEILNVNEVQMLKGVCVLGLFSALLFGQSDTASLSGSVTDPSGAAVTGAKVSLRNLSTGSRRLTVSDVQGTYHFSLLVPGLVVNR